MRMGRFRNKKELKWRNLKQTVKSKILGACIGASMTLRIVTSPELPA
jgi:hypothetical protein